MRGEQTIVIAAVACGAFVAITEPLAISLLRRAAVLDVPCGRSSHTVATPRGGGAPIAVGLVGVCLVARNPVTAAFALAVAAFAAIGLADDLVGLPAGRRLALQAAASAAVAVALTGRLSLPPAMLVVAAAAIALWLAAFVNAFNFMDGVNGIAAAHAAIGGGVYAVLGVWRGHPFLLGAGAAVAACAAAFLPWNAFEARVFLGDVGSYGLGAGLALLAAGAVLSGIPLEAALGPLALFVTDTGWTLQRRIRSGERWLEAHRTHVYQQLCDAGWSHQRVAAVTSAATLALSLLGMASLSGGPAGRLAADGAAAGLLACYLRSPALVGRLSRPSERS